MPKDRLIAEVKDAEAARKIEETVKTGYLEATIDALTNWRGVEEDLADSYEELAARSAGGAAAAAYRRLGDESRKNIEQLASLQSSLERLDRARVQRLKLLESFSE